MKRVLLQLLSLSLLAGCAVGAGSFDELPQGDLITTQSCEVLLDRGAWPLAVGSIEGTSHYVLDTDQGRCVEERDDLIDSLRRHDHGGLVDQLSYAIDNPGHTEIDPECGLCGDPNPHPDKPPVDIESDMDADDSDDGDDAAVVIVWVVVAEDDPDGDMAPAPRSGK
jgi:hypothetical protein